MTREQFEGILEDKEIAENGHYIATICREEQTLWQSSESSSCSTSLPFSITMPETFSDGRQNYPMPPSYFAELRGIPGFRATVQYTLTVTVHKGKVSSILPFGNT